MIKAIKTSLSIVCMTTFTLAHAGTASKPHAGTATAPTDARRAVVGTWLLVRDVNRAPDGTEKSLFGSKPMGQIIFTKDGRYASLNSRSDLPKFAANNRMQGTAEEYKAIGQGSIATFGSYRVSDDGKSLRMTPESSTYPNWNGIEQTRDMSIKGDTFSYKVKASVGGVSELTYRRLK